ncbi:Heat shock protein 70 [Giardia lamblia P15]|uniref:Heat shock protein 70 n=1 Tax=Giardia intestinalis (strain P15) TaxID=658858 RepID=E1F332_GIAIA|nr:Heat shock protein 70 [Giardia lamblia P15]
MMLLLALLLQILAFDAIIDLGCGTYQVGTLKKSAVGNPVDMILNSQSKRHTPSLVAYDGEVFFVGEYAEIFQKRKPGLVFSGFTAGVMEDALNFALDPDASELSVFKGQPATTLLTALINHLVYSQINKPNETIDVTLTIPPGLTLPEISAIRGAIEAVPGVKLLTTVPIPVATAITYLSSRMGTINRTTVSSMSFVIVDLGYHSTDVSVVEALFKPDSTDVQMRVVATSSLKVGGHAITEALIERYISPKIPGLSSKKDLRKYKRAYEAIERGKTALSANTETHMVVESVLQDGGDLHVTLLRSQLNDLLDEMYNETAMQQFAELRALVAEKYKDSIFYFYGAASRALHMQAKMELFFNTSIQKTVNLDEGAIYGAALIAARYGSGHRVSYKFIPSDQTRPQLFYIPNRLTTEESEHLSNNSVTSIPLMRLNPYQRKSINNEIFPYLDDEFIVSNQTITINLEKEVDVEVDDTDEDMKERASESDKASLGDDLDTDVAEGEPFDAVQDSPADTEHSQQQDQTEDIHGDTDLALNETDIAERLKKALENISLELPEKKKKKVQKTISISPHNITAKWISTKTAPFYQISISAGDLLSISCNFYLPEFKQESVLSKYSTGSVVKEKDLAQLEKDISSYNAKIELIIEALRQYLTYPQSTTANKKQRKDDIQDTRDIRVKFLVNITTDSASIPSINFAAIQVQNWSDYNAELQDLIKAKKADKKPKAKVKAVDIEFERKCNVTFSPAFWNGTEVFANGYKLIEDANKVLQNRDHLSHSVNEIESVIYAARDLLEKHPPSKMDEGDVLLYASEGESIVKAIDSAKLFMEELEEKEPCGVNNTCVVERLTSTNETVGALRNAMRVVSDRLAHIRCIAPLREGFGSYVTDRNYSVNSLKAYSKLLKADIAGEEGAETASIAVSDNIINELAKLNETMNSLNLTMTLNTTVDQLKELRDTELICRTLTTLDIDSLLKDYQDEEEKLETEKLEAEKEQKNKSWFKKMIGKGGSEIEEKEKKILYTKDVIRRLKRAKADCGTFTRSADRLRTKIDNVADLHKKASDLYASITAELQMRPETNCTVVNETRTDLDKAIREARWQIAHTQEIVKNTKLASLTNEIRKMSEKAQNHLSYAKRLFQLLNSISDVNLEDISQDVQATLDELVILLRRLRITTVSEKLLEYLKNGGIVELKERNAFAEEPSEATFEEYNSNVTSVLKAALLPSPSINETVADMVNKTTTNTTSTKKEEL